MAAAPFRLDRLLGPVCDRRDRCRRCSEDASALASAESPMFIAAMCSSMSSFPKFLTASAASLSSAGTNDDMFPPSTPSEPVDVFIHPPSSNALNPVSSPAPTPAPPPSSNWNVASLCPPPPVANNHEWDGGGVSQPIEPLFSPKCTQRNGKKTDR